MTFAVSKHDIDAVTKYYSAHRKFEVPQRLQETENQEKGREEKGRGAEAEMEAKSSQQLSP